MKCPICNNESDHDICLVCGYDLENDLIYHNNINLLNDREIQKHNKQIEILKQNYNKPKHNNILDSLDIELLETYGEEYYSQRDFLTAAIYYNEAMLRGSIEAALQMGTMYEYGKGVKRDYYKAFACYSVAADDFDSLAIYKLGTFYQEGYGVEVNYTKARKLYIEAADLGESSAMVALGRMYELGLGVDVNYIKAKRWYNEAIDFDDGEAMIYLSKLYEEGKGCHKNIEKAMYYLDKAVECGFYIGLENIDKLERYKNSKEE